MLTCVKVGENDLINEVRAPTILRRPKNIQIKSVRVNIGDKYLATYHLKTWKLAKYITNHQNISVHLQLTTLNNYVRYAYRLWLVKCYDNKKV